MYEQFTHGLCSPCKMWFYVLIRIQPLIVGLFGQRATSTTVYKPWYTGALAVLPQYSIQLYCVQKAFVALQETIAYAIIKGINVWFSSVTQRSKSAVTGTKTKASALHS